MTKQCPDTAESETLRFGYGDTTLGTIVVAESMRGVAALFIGGGGDHAARFVHDQINFRAGFDLRSVHLDAILAQAHRRFRIARQ